MPNVLGGGDVAGPASATDNAVARFDGTTGKLIQNSTVTIADTTGAIAGAQSLTSPAATNLTLGTTDSGAAITVLTTNKVGIGTTTPGLYDGESNDLVVFRTATAGITIGVSDTTSRAAIRFADGTTGSEAYRGGIEYDHGTGSGGTADSLHFRTAAALRMSINGSGNVLIGTFDATGLTGAGGLKIASTTAGSSGAGALVVQGGISAGQSAQASYFGGSISFPSDKGIVSSVNDGRLFLDGSANQNGGSIILYGSAHGSFPAHTIYAANTHIYKNISGTQQLSLSLTAATFAGAVTASKFASDASSSFSALTATGVRLEANASWGGVLSGYGTTNDVSIFNKSGALVLSVPTGTLAATFAGAVTMSAYGAGAATFDSSGNITSVSDARLKNITGTFTKGLAEIVKLTPKLYTWKPETGLVTDDINATLIAQDLIAAGLPEAVSTYRTVPVMEDDVQSAEDIAAGKPVTQHAKLDAAGKPVTKRVDSNYSVSDRTVIAALVNAVQELKAEIDALKAK